MCELTPAEAYQVDVMRLADACEDATTAWNSIGAMLLTRQVDQAAMAAFEEAKSDFIRHWNRATVEQRQQASDKPIEFCSLTGEAAFERYNVAR